MRIVNFLFAILLFQLGYAQCPTPEIAGDFYGCSGDLLSIRVDTFDINNSYMWTVSTGATVIAPASGNVFVQLPDTTDGTFVLTLTESEPGGCSITVSQNLVIEQAHSMICDDNLNVSLNESCFIDITADIMLENNPYPNDSYIVVVIDNDGDTISTNVNGFAYIGQELTVSVIHGCSENSCWGNITVEDKIAPIIECPTDRTISCFDDTPIANPQAFDNCSNTVNVTEILNVLNAQDCEDNISAIRTLRYLAEDPFGNLSDVCEYTISYEFEDINEVVWPRNYDGVDAMALTCENDPKWDDNGDGYPNVEETGRPTLEGFELFLNNGICKINATYSDDTLDICPSSFKLLRNWTVLDWCTGQVSTSIQIIKVLDEYGPIVECSADFTQEVYTRPYECLANYPVPAPEVIFECSDSTYYTIEYLLSNKQGQAPQGEDIVYVSDNVVPDGNGGYIIEDLPKGLTWLKYTITDPCENETECFSEVYIEDNVTPIPVCDQNTVVGLTTVDFAQVYANTFDDGSYDNCGDVHFEVRRMQPGCNEGTQFDESAIFCCDDIGKTLQVELRVWDDANCNGIFGDEIDVYIDSNNDGIVGNQGDRFVRRVGDNFNTCMVNVQVQDKAAPMIECPPNITVDCLDPTDEASTGGPAIATDNCPGVVVSLFNTFDNIDQCSVGRITRTYRARDKSNLTSNCSYTVTVQNQTPFTGSNINWNTVPNRDLSGCMNTDTHPDQTGYPTWSADACSSIAATYKDEFFSVQDSFCAKILRAWTVIDWCTFDEDENEGIWTYTQVIKLNNEVAPQFESCRNIVECAYNQNCTGDIDLLMIATDDCTDSVDLNYIYTIDIDNDGSIDRPGGGFDLSGNYPVGEHKIIIEVNDGCRNYEQCEFILTMEDCKEPTPYCLSEITTVIMPSTEMIDIWASDFDNGSFDNCTEQENLLFSFSANTNDTQAVFDCDDLGVNDLEMWVTDEAGNKDFCQIKVRIQANDTVCGSTNRIAGFIQTIDQQNMTGININLTDLTLNESSVSATDGSGIYEFYGIMNHSDYRINPIVDEKYMNGVSTLDLVLIQRHILGIDKFDSPYNYIAADVNNNEKISAADLVSLRKLILGIDSKYSNNMSWRFINGDYPIADENQVWPFVEEVNISAGDDLTHSYNFYGVKVGDVNQSASVNFNTIDTEPRSNKPLILTVENEYYQKGDLIKLEVTPEEAYELTGIQYTLSFNNSVLEFVGIESGAIDLNEANMGLNHLEKGLITASWNHVDYLAINDNDVLFSIFFRAVEATEVFGNLAITSDITNSEAYNSALEKSDIILKYSADNEMKTGLVVYQNNPNPFIENTTIGFEISKPGTVVLEVYDMNGRLIYNDSRYFSEGSNKFVLNGNLINTSGVLSYTISTAEEQVHKKMVLIK
jgi:hypothetical protein